MAKISVKAGATSITVNLFIQDSSSTTGAGKTGLAYNTASLTAYYALPAAASAAISLVTQTVTGAYSSGGFVEIDSTNMKGWYRFDVPNAAIASGRFSSIHFQGAANMAPLPLEIELTGWDNQDAVHGGLSCLPNTAVTTNASLLTSGTGTDQLSVTSGRIDIGKALGTAVTLDANNVLNVSAKYLAGTALTGRDIGASVLLAAGQKVDVDTIKTNPVVNAGTVTFPTGATLASTTNITAGTITTTTNVTNAPTAGDFTATMKASITTAATAATPTAAAVTGAVGSVTGNVGGNVNGNVVGSVASVTAGVTVTTNNDKTGYALSTAGAGSIWDVVLSGHVTAGSTGAALNAAGGAGDPWQTTLPGAYVAGQAGYIVGNNLNASISGIPGSLFGTAVDGAFTFSQSIRLQNSAMWGPISGCVTGASGTATLQNVTGGTNRMTIPYDSNGNRTAAATILNDAL